MCGDPELVSRNIGFLPINFFLCFLKKKEEYSMTLVIVDEQTLSSFFKTVLSSNCLDMFQICFFFVPHAFFDISQCN